MASHTDDDAHHGLALVLGPDSASAAAGRTALWLATLAAALLVLVAATDFAPGSGLDAGLVALTLAAGPALGAWVAGRRAGLLFTGLVVAAPLAGIAGAYLVGALLGVADAYLEAVLLGVTGVPDVRPWALAVSAVGYLLFGTGAAFALGRIVSVAARER